MKRKILSILVLAMITVSTTFAAGDDISKNAQATLTASFAKATEIKWEKENDYYKASFQMNNQSLTAFVAEDGKLIAVSRNILSTELPINLKISLDNNFSGNWISSLVEYAIDGETKYFITIENADKKTILESVGTHDWTVFDKSVK